MRLVLVTPFLETRGGLDRVILKIAEHFDARIHCIRYDPENSFSEFEALDIRVAKPGLLSKLPALKRVTTAVEAGKYFYNLKLDDYDVINAHQTPSEWIRHKNSKVIWYCLHEDTPTLRKTPTGYSYCSMKDLKEGDQLFSFTKDHKSSHAKVLKKKTKKASNLGILRLANGREITATKDHKFFVYENGDFTEKKLAKICKGDLIPIPSKLVNVNRPPAFLDVENVLKKKYENHPYWADRLFVDFNRKFIAIGNRKTILLPAKIPVCAELMKLLGYYASEGYIHFRHAQKREDMQLGFSFGMHEKNTLVKDCVRCSRKVFGIEPSVKEVPQRSEILVILPNICAMFMLALGCGSKARNKRIPDLVFSCHSKLQKKFLEAYLMGDGYYEKKAKRWVCTSVGQHLITGLVYLLSMLGKQATIVRRQAHKFNNYNDRLDHQTYSLRFSDKGYVRYKKLGKLLLIPVREVLDLKEKALVVDIEVEGNHSFLAGDAIYTHNCHTPNREAFDLYKWRMQRRSIFSKPFFWSSIQAFKFFESRTVPNIEHIFTNSKNSQSRIKKYLDRESEVLYPTVDPEKFKCRESENFFFYPSRIAPEKDFEYAIDAFKLFAARVPGWKLVIAGSLSNRKDHLEYKKQIKARGGSHIIIEPNVPDDRLIDLYSRCHAVLYTPVNEDFGLVPLEALASSKPCIAKNEGGPKETIHDGKDGFLVDSIWDMSKKMEWLAKNPDACKKMGEVGRRKVKREFTWEKFLKRFEEKAREISSSS